jgi:hypothetical protein
MRRLSLLLALLFAAAGLRAGTNSADLGGAFNDIGDGTRPLGLGGAFTAVADDANAVAENPAGMAFFDAKDHLATFTHSALYNLDFLSRDFVAYGQGDTGYTALGFYFDRLSADLSPNSYSENTFAYAGAKLLMGADADSWPKLAVGWQIKYLNVQSDFGFESSNNVGTDVGGGTANGWGSGLGALLKLRPNFALGLMIQDLYSPLHWGTGTTEIVPTNSRLGFVYNLTDTSLFSAEFRAQNDSSGLEPDSWHAGLEHWFLDGKKLQWDMIKNIGVRAGFYELLENQDGGTLSVGATLMSDLWELDYTFEYDLGGVIALGETQRFGLGVRF